MQVAGKAFIVTGGGSGLGAATARMLTEAGGRVLVADVQDAAAPEGGAFLRTDVTSETDGQAAVDGAVRAFGGLHGLVNCAGVVIGERVAGRDGPHRLDSFMRVVAINLVDTPIYGEGEASEQFKANLEKGVLFPRRLGRPDELASVVVEAVTNSYLNAETIRVDGGIRMQPK